MPLVSVLLVLIAALALSGPPAAPAAVAPAPEATADAPASAVWRASSVVSEDGALRFLPGWRVRLGVDGRAHLLGPSPRSPQPAGLWDDAAAARGLRVAVRATARDAAAVYVEGRVWASGGGASGAGGPGPRARPFLLRWDAATGVWAEAATPVPSL